MLHLLMMLFFTLTIATKVPLDQGSSFIRADHELKNGFPGQPSSGINFKQFAGEISVDPTAERALFYYFVESATNSSTNPLILWLNGGKAIHHHMYLCLTWLFISWHRTLTEIGPFGVNPDGLTLYAREFAWNKVANVLFLESPAGVGFSYSNTTSDYNSTGDHRTAENTYAFLVKWLEMYPTFKRRDLYLIGEDYAGYYIPELADIILENVKNLKDTTPIINLKGIMIGNGLMDEESDVRGVIDYAWTHALVSDETHKELTERCTGSLYRTKSCIEAESRYLIEIEMLNFVNLYKPKCSRHTSITRLITKQSDPCGLLYVQSYLNLPQVQSALNANRTTWMPCSDVIRQWHDGPSSMFPIYKTLMGHGLRILLYSGDVDASVPVTSTRYALAAMGLKVIKPWHLWTTSNTSMEVAGFKVVYDGLTYATILGAGHQVPLSYPDRLFHLLKDFLR